MIDIIPKLIGAKVDAIGLRDYFGKMSNIAHFKFLGAIRSLDLLLRGLGRGGRAV